MLFRIYAFLLSLSFMVSTQIQAMRPDVEEEKSSVARVLPLKNLALKAVQKTFAFEDAKLDKWSAIEGCLPKKLTMTGLNTLFTSLAYCGYLVEVNLSGCDLKSLPREMASLKNLERLMLWNNRLTDVSCLSGLVGLIELDLSENYLTALPIGFAKLTRLQNLDLSINNMCDSENLIFPPNLQKLTLFFSGLQQVPAELRFLGSLTYLTFISDDMLNLERLEYCMSLQTVNFVVRNVDVRDYVQQLQDMRPKLAILHKTHFLND